MMSPDLGATLAGVAAFLAVMIAIAGVACAVLRVRRIVAVAVLLAAALPLGAGLLGEISAEIDHYRVIEMLAAPTPQDLNAVDEKGERSLLLGFAGTCLCLLTGVAALMRSNCDESAPSTADDLPTDEV